MRPEGSRREFNLVARRLIDEFNDPIDVDMILRLAREEVSLFDRAKVRDLVATFAGLLARDRIRKTLERVSRAMSPLPPAVHEYRSERLAQTAIWMQFVPEPGGSDATLGPTLSRAAR